MNEQPHARKILQLTPQGKLLRVYESVSAGARAMGISRTAITNVLKKTSGLYYSGGYVWKYLDNFTEEQLTKMYDEIK